MEKWMLKNRTNGQIIAHFLDDANAEVAKHAFNQRKMDLTIIPTKSKNYMDLKACELHNCNSVDYLKEAMRIIDDFVYVPELRTQVLELIHAARAKAIIETAQKIEVKTKHIASDVKHLLNPLDEF
jgi:hypothetical protein